MNHNKAKSTTSTIILVFIFFVGLSVLLYPAVSDYINSKHQSRAVASYSEVVADMTDEQNETLLRKAEDYNRRLSLTNGKGFFDPSLVKGYEEILDVSGTGIMGYISIDKLHLELPIYHGLSDGVLQIASGHIEGSSFPVGGVNTHAAISGHRGLPSARLFTDLDELEVGDRFTVTVLNRVVTYEVDKISIVLPTEVDGLQIIDGESYCTLVTCTPYGINTHRLLVRGKQVDGISKPHIYVEAEAYKIDPIVVTPAVAAPMLLILLIWMLFTSRKRKEDVLEKMRKDDAGR